MCLGIVDLRSLNYCRRERFSVCLKLCALLFDLFSECVFVEVSRFCGCGIAPNLNTAQAVSINNMHYFSTVTTTHGIQMK